MYSVTISLKGKKNVFLEVEGKYITWKKFAAVFNILISYCIYKTCALQMYFWKLGKWYFFLGSLTSEYQEEQLVSCNQVMSKSDW